MTNPAIKAIFFDMGWTLRHTVKDPIQQQAWLEKIIVLTGLPWSPAEMGKQFTERALAYKKWGEESLVELCPTDLWLDWMLPELPREFVQANAIEMNRYWRKAIGEGQLVPHATEVVRELFQRGYRLGIISNTVSSEETPNLVKKFGIDQYFEITILSCNFGKRKPDPSIFHAATDWMGVAPSNCAYVGDQIDRDIYGSKHAGFNLAIQIKHAQDKQDTPGIYFEKPDHVIYSLTELLDIFPKRYHKAVDAPAPHSKSNGKHAWKVSLSTMWSHENNIALPELLPILEGLDLSGIELSHRINSENLFGFDLDRFPIRSLHEPCPSDVSTVVLAKKDWLISATDEHKRQQGVRMMMRTIDLAQELGVGHIVVHAGTAGLPDLDEKQLRNLHEAGKKDSDEYLALKQAMIDKRNAVIEGRMNSVVRSIKELLAYASGKNIRLALENRYHLYDIPVPDELEMLLSLAGPDRIGFQFDVGHGQALDAMGFYSFMEWVDRFSDRIVGLHLHDVRGVVDHYSPGLGEIDYRRFAKMIPVDAQRTLEVHGSNSIDDIYSGLQLLGDTGLIYRM